MLLDIARAGRGIILSTGMATLAEVEQALAVLAFGYARRTETPSRKAFADAWADPAVRRGLDGRVVLLHCTTEYPAPVESANLRAIGTLASKFGLPVGFSDHTPGIDVAAAAVALGATVIEKHLTLDRDAPGPDHAASIEPVTFQDMTDNIRRIERALGDGEKRPQPGELANMPIARKTLVALRGIAKGEVFNPENIGIKRAGTGLAPVHYWDLLGSNAPRSFQPDEAIEL
jgi:N-acetylneuraminate synthase